MDPLNNPVLRRRGHLNFEITKKDECYYCKTSPLRETDTYCPSCGFPQNGAREDQVKFIQAKKLLLIKVDEMNDKAKRATGALFGAAALFAVSYLVGYLSIPNDLLLIEGGVVVTLFVGLGIWSTRNAYPAVLTGIICMTTLLLAYAVINPKTIASGVLWKILIYSSLIYGMKASGEARKMAEELKAEKIDLGSGRS